MSAPLRWRAAPSARYLSPMPARDTSQRKRRGFARAGVLVEGSVNAAGRSRGFAIARLLTHWAEVAGAEVASRARPVKVAYGRGALGATLTLLCRGADAPLVQMQAPRIVERVNALYGYAAIKTIRLTQTAPDGFAEGQAEYAAPNVAPLSDDARAKLRDIASGIEDPELKRALEGLAENVLRRQE